MAEPTIARRALLLQSLALGLAGAGAARGQSPDVLRAVWLGGNPVQARLDATGQAHGPAVDLAETLAMRLGRRLELSAAPNPNAVLDRVRQGQADIGFAAFDPSRAEGLVFSPPYEMSLNRFAVRAGSTIVRQDQVDHAGVRVGAVPTDAGGLYLQRTLKAAALTPQASVDAGVAALLAGAIDVMAANGQRLADILGTGSDFGILPGSFFGVPQVIAVRLQDTALAAQAAALVKAQLASGAVAQSIRRWGLTGAEAAPA